MRRAAAHVALFIFAIGGGLIAIFGDLQFGTAIVLACLFFSYLLTDGGRQ